MYVPPPYFEVMVNLLWQLFSDHVIIFNLSPYYCVCLAPSHAIPFREVAHKLRLNWRWVQRLKLALFPFAILILLVTTPEKNNHTFWRALLSPLSIFKQAGLVTGSFSDFFKTVEGIKPYTLLHPPAFRIGISNSQVMIRRGSKLD